MRATTTGCSRRRSSAGGRIRATSTQRLPRARRATRALATAALQRRRARRRRLPGRRRVRADPHPRDRARPGGRRGRGRRRSAPVVAVAEAELAARARTPASRSRRGRVPRAARLPAGQADAAGRRAGVRPHGGGRPRDGVALIVISGFRSNAEQAACSPRIPTRGGSRRRAGRCTGSAPSSTSGRPSAYGWLAANAPRFGFVRRMDWEPWHFGLHANAGSTSVGFGGGATAAPRLPSFVPAALRAPDRRARRSAGTSPPRCWPHSSTPSPASTRSRVSPAGAQGIAQFMPATARALRAARPVRRRRRRSTPRPT